MPHRIRLPHVPSAFGRSAPIDSPSRAGMARAPEVHSSGRVDGLTGAPRAALSRGARQSLSCISEGGVGHRDDLHPVLPSSLTADARRARNTATETTSVRSRDKAAPDSGRAALLAIPLVLLEGVTGWGFEGLCRLWQVLS